ncbi:YkvA family protein [Scytonema sp. NUACC26]|uniref:YkvA family protein n=1 Tax=Scytonema sp. NUACC26 TaxID=3140176 RepID=UPI0034DC3E9C
MNFSIQSVYTWYRSTLRNPKYRWWIVLGTLLYVVSPFDIAPDFIPVLGELDDVVILTLLVSEVSQILIEGFKARQNKDGVEAASTAENSTSTKETIDIDAVSVK